MADTSGIAVVGCASAVPRELFGERAERLHDLASHGFPVPRSVAVSAAEVDRINAGSAGCLEHAAGYFRPGSLLAVRPSPESRIWNGVNASFNIGMSEAARAAIARQVGDKASYAIYADFIHAFAIDAAAVAPHLVSEAEDSVSDPAERTAALLALFERQTGEPFPQDPHTQLVQICRSIARMWNSPDRAALRRAESGDAGVRLGLIIQAMADGFRGDGCGSGKLSSIHRESGESAVSGHLTVFRGGRPLYGGGEEPVNAYMPGQADRIAQLLAELRRHFRDPQVIEFAFDGSDLWLLDSVSADRSVSAAIRAAVELANDGIIAKEESLLRVSPDSLGKVLHPQVRPASRNQVIAKGIPASPGAAAGVIAFSSRSAERFVAAGKDCILVRAETGPEDFRGMHTAQGVLTGRGGLTSHAAVVARGLGVPCVVGAADIQIAASEPGTDAGARVLNPRLGIELDEGDVITVDGTTGKVLKGKADLEEPSLNQYFEAFLAWADEVRDIGVQANADTIDEVRAAKKFKADGIGLCRTEHMYFEESQLTVMRRMLFVESPDERTVVLRQLIQMQKRDFTQIFREMPGRTVCIRLFDPPLHEFLPRARREMQRLAEELGRDVRHVMQRADELKEFNPMLGMRGVRVGIVMPEIYEMQARAIFEAVVEVRRQGMEAVPEIMIPLVSANREVELVREHVGRVAASVRKSSRIGFQYRLGVMVETPRAALRAGDLAKNSDFLSFGTNDLTQMTYGLSRDDSQRFMEDYIGQGVYPSDPFGTLDREGVGELLKIAASRAREASSRLTLSICGEHGGDPASILFCRDLGFDYVSCSPYRVPIARLAAAHCALGRSEGTKKQQ